MFTGLTDPSLWVAVAFFGFVAILLYKKVPAMIGQSLDQRAERISREMEQARALREEAEDVLARYQIKLREAEKEASAIIEMAEKEARALARETEEKLTLELERRTRQAEEKINRVKLQAINEVRSMASDVSIAAAGEFIRQNGPGKADDDLISQVIDAIPETFSRKH
jgi:F-type H+-transporting ATPase subunit b